MVGAAAAITVAIIAASAVVLAAGGMAISSVVASNRAAEAAEKAAEMNAKATVQAAKEAAHAQIESAKQDAGARMHESDVAFQQEQEYLKFEKWAMEREDGMDNYYRETQNSIDTIDTVGYNTDPWGAGTEDPYFYGNGAGEMEFS